MSRYSPNGMFGAVAPERRTISPHAVLDWIIERIRIAQYRRQRQELLDYLASDHRAARDLGITSHETGNLWR